jgi:hypothetical protein
MIFQHVRLCKYLFYQEIPSYSPYARIMQVKMAGWHERLWFLSGGKLKKAMPGEDGRTKEAVPNVEK